MSWELRYQEEVMPVIEEYINEETSSFTSSDIAEFSEELEPDFVGRVLKHADTDTILKTENNPATWEALYVETYQEGPVKHILEPESYKDEKETENEKPVEKALESLDTDSIGRIYSYFRNTLEIKNDQKIKGLITEYRERR
ncbi:hypothetical protein [Candidatus Nanohalovita haloferacivicina]|uniref:hypothetical protein n=1 Tax=Candidatus Nanohalovita haloferacivicina TaxID=2978046 RepID=UPI00325FDD4D|nr:hypothetical protein HBNXNv_0140 [Candidatus Nanohalobia archaeon BNXNv]